MALFPTNASQVQAFAGALYGVQVGSTTMTQVNSDITAAGGLSNALNAYYTASFGGLTTAAVAASMVSNLGISAANTEAATAYVKGVLDGTAANARGAAIMNILNLYAGMSADATFGADATAWNAKVETAAAYTGSSNVAIGTVVATSAVFTLTTNADIADNNSAVRGSLTSTFKFTAGNETVDANTSTISTGDTLLDSSTADNDTLNITASAANSVEMVVSNIETVNVTSSSDSAALDTTAWTGVKNVNVTGTGDFALNDLDAQTVQPTVAISGYAQIATVNVATLAGTTVDSSAETVNLSVSGTQYGTTAATRSGITLTADTAGTLETLNITSTGTNANDWALDASTNVSLGTVNLLGTTAQTLRVSHADITGVTVVGTNATGEAVRINRESASTTATNVGNFADVENIIVADDATSPAAALVLSSVKSGQKITLVDDAASSSSISMQSATRTAPAAALTLILDNDTAATDTDIGGLDIQNTVTLSLQSLGNVSTSTASSAVNDISALTGDFTAINITGDTSASVVLAIDAAGALSDTARTVTVDAAGLTGTAFANFSVANDASTVDTDRLITYKITGTANSDTFDMTYADAGNTLTAAAGNDTITGGNGADAINGGEGNDLVNVTVGADTVTGGAGNDTFDINVSTTAVAQANTITLDNGANTSEDTWSTGDTITVTLNGVSETYTVTAADAATDETAGGGSNEDAAVIGGSLANFINLKFGATVTATASSGVVTITADTAGTPFTLAVADSDSTATAVAAATSTVNVGDVNTTISDFSVGDVIDTQGLSGLGAGYIEIVADITEASSSGDYGVIVLTNSSYASADAAEDIVAGQIGADTDDVVIVFLNSATGKAEAFFDGDVGANDSIASTALLFTFDNITTLTGLASTFSTDSFVI